MAAAAAALSGRKWSTARVLHRALPDRNTPSENPHTSYYWLEVKDVQKLKLASAVRTAFEASKKAGESPSLQLSLRFTFFSASSKAFFGAPWTLDEVEMDAVKCTKKTAQTVAFEGDDGNQSAYFYSKINDKRCYLVFEAIVRLRRSTSCTINEYGVGWGYLSVFALSGSDGRSHGETYHFSSLHHGSPRALLFTPHDEWGDKFQKMSGIGMRWQIQMVKRLKRLEHLFPANALVPRDEPLGGVADDSAGGDQGRGGINPAPSDPSELLDPLQSSLVVVTESRVWVPAQFESELLQRFVGDAPGAAVPYVVKRELRVAAHNGRAVLGSWRTVRLEPSPEDGQILDVVETERDGSSGGYGNGRIRLEEIRMDKLVAVVMCLNYVVEVPSATGSSQVLVWAGTAVWLPCGASPYEVENMRLDPDDEDSKTSRSNEVLFETGPKRWFGGASQTFVSSDSVRPCIGFHVPDDEEAAYERRQVAVERESTVRQDIAARKSGDPPRASTVTLKTASGGARAASGGAATMRASSRPVSRVDAPPRPRREAGRSSARRSRRSEGRSRRRRGGSRRRRRDLSESESDSSDDDDAGVYGGGLLSRSRNMPLHQSTDTQRGGVLRSGAQTHARAVAFASSGATFGPAATAGALGRDFMQTSQGQLTFAPRVGNATMPSARVLDRASRSVLDRSGYTGRSVGDANAFAVGRGGALRESARSAAAQGEREVWVRTESADPNGCHDIGLQFAALRMSGAAQAPRSVVLKYQLYTQPYYATPPLVLLGTSSGGRGGAASSKTAGGGASSKSSSSGGARKAVGGGGGPGERTYLLEREGAGPDSTLKRFVIDTTAAPEDAKRFAHFLFTKRLQVDVWDADSLLQIGTASMPLSVLARQQQNAIKVSLELEVTPTRGHVVPDASGSRLAAGGAGGGAGGESSAAAVGWLQVVATNTGQRGRFNLTRKPQSALALANGVGGGTGIGPGARRDAGAVVQPSARIRARPLIADNPELAELVPALAASLRAGGRGLGRGGGDEVRGRGESDGGGAGDDDDLGVLSTAEFNAVVARLGGDSVSPARLCSFVRCCELLASDAQSEAAAAERDATVLEKLHALAPHAGAIVESIAQIPISFGGESAPGLARRSALMEVLSIEGTGDSLGAVEAVALCLTGPGGGAGRGGDRLVAYEPLFDEMQWTCGGRRERLHKVRARLREWATAAFGGATGSGGAGAGATKSVGGGGVAGDARAALAEWVGTINDRLRRADAGLDGGAAAWTMFLSALHDKGLQLDAPLEDALRSVVWDFPGVAPAADEVASVDAHAFGALAFGESAEVVSAATKLIRAVQRYPGKWKGFSALALCASAAQVQAGAASGGRFDTTSSWWWAKRSVALGPWVSVLRLAISQGGGGAASKSSSEAAAALDPLQQRQQRRLAAFQKQQRRGGRGGRERESELSVYRPGASSRGPTGDDGLLEEKRTLWTMQRFRTARKTALVQKLLQKDMTTDATIWPSMGRAELIEVTVTNPFEHEERFKIKGVGDGNRGELRVITTTSEWRTFRDAAPPGGGWQNAAADLDAAMMPLTEQLFDSQMEFTLNARETMIVPFAYISFRPCSPTAGGGGRGRYGADDAGSASSKRSDDRRRGSSKSGGGGATEVVARGAGGGEWHTRHTRVVRIRSERHAHDIAVLRLHVQPVPHTVDRTILLYQAQHEVMRRRIALQLSSTRLSGAFVHCSDSQVLINVSDAQPSLVRAGGFAHGAGGVEARGLEVHIKARIGSFPSVREFQLMVFSDQYHASIDQIWKVQVHAMLRQDIHASLGSTSTSLLPMQGDSFDRTAACFSSSPLEVFFSDGESASSSASSRGAAVRLEPRISNQLRFTFRPASVGNTQHIIHVVDVDERKLLFAWIVHAHCSAPTVGKTFNVAVPARRAVAKRISYTNEWDTPRVFLIRTSHPQLVKVTEPRVEIPPHASAFIRLWFVPAEPTNADVLVFINNESEQNEECLLVRVRVG